MSISIHRSLVPPKMPGILRFEEAFNTMHSAKIHFPATFRQPGFLDLLCDALFQLRLAKETENAYRQNRHARASIAASVFSIESGANCLLANLNISSVLGADVERLPALSKFEFYLRASLDMPFDRSRIEVCKVKELIQARNDFVHPKVANIEAEMGSLEDSGDAVVWSIGMLPQFRKATKLPKDALFWNAEHAAMAFATVSDFFAYLFDDLMKADRDEVQKILFHKMEASVADLSVVINSHFGEFNDELEHASNEGFNLAFLGFANPQGANLNV